MGAEEIKFFNVTSQWSLLTGRHGFYINNGNVDLYLQQKSGAAPSQAESGVRIRVNGGFFLSVEMQDKTYVRTAAGTTQLAKYENQNIGNGASALIDPASGNAAVINGMGYMGFTQHYADDNTGEYSELSVQHPLPVDGDSVYAKDVWVEESVATNWVDVSATGLSPILIPFTNLHTKITNATTDNPKILVIHFNRTVNLSQIAIGCYEGGDFSNLKLKLIGSGGEILHTLDDSANNTKYTSRNYGFPPNIANSIQLEFHTADQVCISNFYIAKGRRNISRLQAIGDDGTVVDIGAHQSVDGDFHLSVAAVQNAWTDPANSSVVNLTSENAYSFTGEATTTLGVNVIQGFLKCDQNAYVYVDQSSDGTNWDVTDLFRYFYSKGGQGVAVKAAGSFYCVRVVLNGTAPTAFFRLIAKLMPIGEPLPRSLDTYGRLKTSTGIIDVETETKATVDSLGCLKTVSPVRLVGTAFNNGTKDPNFWTETVTGSGAVTQAGQITLSTGTTADSSARYETLKKARKVTGATNQFRAVGRLTTPVQDNNVRRIGPYNNDNGFFFQVDGLTFGVGARKSGVDTIIADGDFNGNYGNSLNIDTTLKRLTIDYTSTEARFFVDSILLHTFSSPSDAVINSLDLPARMECYNINGNATDNAFQIRFACIVRLGELETSPNVVGFAANGTYVLKYGSGVLQRIIITDNAGTITMHDNTAATGTPFATIDAIKTNGGLEFRAPFSNGLTVVVAGGAKVTVIYE